MRSLWKSNNTEHAVLSSQTLQQDIKIRLLLEDNSMGNPSPPFFVNRAGAGTGQIFIYFQGCSFFFSQSLANPGGVKRTSRRSSVEKQQGKACQLLLQLNRDCWSFFIHALAGGGSSKQPGLSTSNSDKTQLGMLKITPLHEQSHPARW